MAHRAVPLLFLAILAGAPARAASCPVSAAFDPGLDAVDGETRLGFLYEGMQHAAKKASVWRWSWLGIYSTLAVGQLALIPAFTEEARVDRYVSAAGATLGALVIAFNPLAVIRDARTFDRLMSARRAGDDPCVILAEAERMLLRDARMEDRVNRWWTRAGTIGFNAACVAFLALGFHRYTGAALNGVGGMTVGQLMINTQPTESLRLLKRYRSGSLDGPPLPLPIAWMVAPLVTPTVWGVQAEVTF